jgi:hypothetical protein
MSRHCAGPFSGMVQWVAETRFCACALLLIGPQVYLALALALVKLVRVL